MEEIGRRTGGKGVSLEDLTPAERAYYRDTWGFDPVADKKDSPRRPNVSYYYESPVPLENDPELRSAGVTMHARVEADENGRSHNRIVFTRGEKSVAVECVHTAVYAAPAREISELPEEKLKELATSTGGRPAILPPWEHFAALKSFAAGIAAVGLLWLGDQIPPSKQDYGKQHLPDLPIPGRLMAQIHATVFTLVPELVPKFLESLDFDALLSLGIQQLNAGFPKQAIDYLEQATRLNPASVDAWYGLGLAYHGSKIYPPAIHAYEQVVRLDPEHAGAWIHLSAARSFNGDPAGSLDAMDRWQALR